MSKARVRRRPGAISCRTHLGSSVRPQRRFSAALLGLWTEVCDQFTTILGLFASSTTAGEWGNRLRMEELEQRQMMAAFDLNNAVYRPSNATLYFDYDQNGVADQQRTFGVPGDTLVKGDLNGDGLTDLSVYRSGIWYVDLNRDSIADRFFAFGIDGDIPLAGDFNGDGTDDLIVYRPSNGAWFIDVNGDGAADAASGYGGAMGDIPVVADFNGDDRLDRAIYRGGTWLVDYGFLGAVATTWNYGGAPGDIPFSADYNDDQQDDLVIFRNGALLINTNKVGAPTQTLYFGTAGDIPLPGSYDFKDVSHGLRTNFGIYRPSNSGVYLEYNQGASPVQVRVFGAPGDKPVVGDFNADTVADVAMFRNGTWYIDTNKDSIPETTVIFGQAGDVPLAGDVNNDGYDDLIVYRDGAWYISTTRTGVADIVSVFGLPTDVPLVGDLNADGVSDRVIYRPGDGSWHVDFSFAGSATAFYGFGGGMQDIPVLADFNNDHKDDLAIFRDGTWFIDTTRSGMASIYYNFGVAGDIPLPGFHDAGNSLFVRAGSNGVGTQASPYGTINAAAAAATSGQFIRIAPGTYNENVLFNLKNNLTFVGASRHYTNVRPATGSAFFVANSNNITVSGLNFSSQDLSAGQGRGLVVFGSSVFADGIRTGNNANEGVYAAASNDNLALLDLRNSDVGTSQRSAGLFIEAGATVRASNVTSNSNGLSGGQPNVFGRGIVLLGTPGKPSTATFRNVTALANSDHGFIADGTANVLLERSNFSLNPNSNGALINGSVTFIVDSSTFAHNGTTRDASLGFNGLEVNINNTATGKILNSLFRDNTAYGTFLGTGTNLLLQGNTYDNNLIGVGVNGVNQGGVVQGGTSATIIGNYFVVPGPVTDDVGIFVYGAATATVGGAGAKKNTFESFKLQYVWHMHPDPNTDAYGTIDGGDGLSFDDANTFIDSPAPHGYVGPTV